MTGSSANIDCWWLEKSKEWKLQITRDELSCQRPLMHSQILAVLNVWQQKRIREITRNQEYKHTKSFTRNLVRVRSCDFVDRSAFVAAKRAARSL